MTIKFARYINPKDENGLSDINKCEKVTFEFETQGQAMDWITQQLEEFKIKNCVRDETKDKSFLRYKSQLLDSLATQVTNEMDDFDHCNKCPVSEWEGEENRFCRCEDRNIRVARYKRIQQGASC